MRNHRRMAITSLAEGTITIRIPTEFEQLNESGALGWKTEDPIIITQLSKSTTDSLIQKALNSFPQTIKASEGEITIKIPFSYESIGNGKLGWSVKSPIIGSPANREFTIRTIKKVLNL